MLCETAQRLSVPTFDRKTRKPEGRVIGNFSVRQVRKHFNQGWDGAELTGSSFRGKREFGRLKRSHRVDARREPVATSDLMGRKRRGMPGSSAKASKVGKREGEGKVD